MKLNEIIIKVMEIRYEFEDKFFIIDGLMYKNREMCFCTECAPVVFQSKSELMRVNGKPDNKPAEILRQPCFAPSCPKCIRGKKVYPDGNQVDVLVMNCASNAAREITTVEEGKKLGIITK